MSPAPRDAENVEAVVADFKRRTEGRLMDLMTGDDYPVYATAILGAYGDEVEDVTHSGRGPAGCPSRSVCSPGASVRATVEERREKGRVVEILTRVVFGTMAAVQAALARSKVSRWINTSFVERHNATDRHHNGRKVRRTYTSSKDWRVHESMTYFTMYQYNFCWPVRTLAERERDGARLRKRTPAMAAGSAIMSGT